MQRSGPNITLILILAVTVTSCVSYTKKNYADDDMARLATVVRTTMSIIKGKYYGETIPLKISEAEVIKIVREENSAHFKELDQLEGSIELVIVSNGKNMAAIVWDSSNNRKLMQDLRCTVMLDDFTWKRVEYGNQFTLGWGKCL